MFLFLILVLVFVIPIFLLEQWKYRKQRGFKMPPKHPESWPVLGFAHLLFKTKDTRCLLRVSDEIAETTHALGGVCSGYLGPVLIYAITDADDAITVMNTCLEKKFVYNLATRWVGDGLAGFTHNLTLWKRHRKIINRAFNQQILDIYIGTFNKSCRRLVQDLAKKVDAGSFEHFPLLTDFSLEVMYQTTMGFEEDQLTEDVYPKEHKEAIEMMLDTLVTRFQTYWMHSDFLFSFTSLKKKEDQLLNCLKKTSHSVLRKKREILSNMEKRSKKAISFLDFLLALPPEDAFTDEEVIGELDNMMVAGSDTTSTILTYALVLLGSYHDIQQEVYEELKTVFGDSSRDVEKADISKLVFLEAVLMETMRLFPILPVVPRYVSKDTQIKNYTLPAGSTCLVFAKHIHKNPGIWGEDAGLFRPRRWIEGVPLAASRAYKGFSIGKRRCIGKTYALMSMKTTLAHVLRHYKIVADVTKLKLKLDLLLKPASGCDITILTRT